MGFCKGGIMFEGQVEMLLRQGAFPLLFPDSTGKEVGFAVGLIPLQEGRQNEPRLIHFPRFDIGGCQFYLNFRVFRELGGYLLYSRKGISTFQILTFHGGEVCRGLCVVLIHRKGLTVVFFCVFPLSLPVEHRSKVVVPLRVLRIDSKEVPKGLFRLIQLAVLFQGDPQVVESLNPAWMAFYTSLVLCNCIFIFALCLQCKSQVISQGGVIIIPGQPFLEDFDRFIIISRILIDGS